MANGEALVSLIIPAYNDEKYLARCLDSVISQTYKNLQILLVDDGSTDASGKICDRYAVQDQRIQVLHQQNAGVSVARNHALDVATGEYLAFTDADDQVEPDYIETLVKNIPGHDMVLCGYHFVENDGEITDMHLDQDCVVDAHTLLQYHLEDEITVFQGQRKRPFIGSYLWNKLFRRHIWGDIRFLPHRTMEDVLAVTSYVAKIDRINCLTVCKYFYYKIMGSATNQCELSIHSGDMLIMRQGQRALVQAFLRQRHIDDYKLWEEMNLLVLSAYANIFTKYLKAHAEQSSDCQKYFHDFGDEFQKHYSCLYLCKNLRLFLKLLLCYLAPDLYCWIWRVKQLLINNEE